MRKNIPSLFLVGFIIQTIIVLVFIQQQFQIMQQFEQIVTNSNLIKNKPAAGIKETLLVTNQSLKAGWLIKEKKLRYIIREELANAEMNLVEEKIQVDEKELYTVFGIDESELEDVYTALEILLASGSTNFMGLEQFYNRLEKLNSVQQRDIMSRLSNAINSQYLIINNQ